MENSLFQKTKRKDWSYDPEVAKAQKQHNSLASRKARKKTTTLSLLEEFLRED